MKYTTVTLLTSVGQMCISHAVQNLLAVIGRCAFSPVIHAGTRHIVHVTYTPRGQESPTCSLTSADSKQLFLNVECWRALLKLRTTTTTLTLFMPKPVSTYSCLWPFCVDCRWLHDSTFHLKRLLDKTYIRRTPLCTIHVFARAWERCVTCQMQGQTSVAPTGTDRQTG